MSQVEIRDIRKTFGAVEVLHGVSLDITDGKFVALVGPSGCGKSTLLRMIAGLETVTFGDILIGGKHVNDAPPKDRDIAMVFQNYALYPHMSVAENLGFSLRMRGENKAKVQNEVAKAAEILGLDNLLSRYPRQLSGGQRQRVAMGRAIVRNPKVFLFDEPLSNLDAKLRVQMRTEIKELQQRLSTTTIYVTHDQIEAMTMADEIVVMRDGAIEQIGSPLDLYDRPMTLFVAEFIGSPAMNFMEGTLATDGSGATVVAADGIALPLEGNWKHQSGRSVIYGIRPENITLAATGVPATVSVLEPTGPDTLIFLQMGNNKVTSLVHQRVTAKPGDLANLAIDASQAHVFDRKSGKRLEQ